MDTRLPLAGKRVLVTRPAERAVPLAAAIEEAGGIALRFPVIEILPLCHAALPAGSPEAYDAIVFVSPAAVTHGLRLLGLRAGSGPLVGAVGPATSRTLREAGFPIGIEPGDSHDSEGLLKAGPLAAERIAGRRVLIVRGEGGREHLAEGLMARGAAVDYAEVYRRVRPVARNPEVVRTADIITVTSREGLANLLAMVDEPTRRWALGRPVAVNSERVAVAARHSGFAREPCVAERPGDAGLVQAIVRCADRWPEARSEPE